MTETLTFYGGPWDGETRSIQFASAPTMWIEFPQIRPSDHGKFLAPRDPEQVPLPAISTGRYQRTSEMNAAGTRIYTWQT